MTIHYFDATLGDDANPGTIAEPQKTIEKVKEALDASNPGDSALLKRGETWFCDGTVSVELPYGMDGISVHLRDGSSGSPVTIGAYGVGPKPIIESYRPLPGAADAGNWHDYGATVANTWYIEVAFLDGLNLFVGGVRKYPAMTAGEVSSVYPWFWGDIGGTNRLLVYSVANPSALDFRDTLAQVPLIIRGSSYITVSGLDLRGSSSGVLIQPWTATGRASRYIVIENCNIGLDSYEGIGLIDGAGTLDSEYITVSGCTIDNGSPPLPPYDTQNPPVITHGIRLYACDHAVVRDCVFGQWTHASIHMNDKDTGATVRYADIHDNVFGGDGATYNRAFGMDGTAEGRCSYNLFHDNIITSGVTIRSQMNGDHNKFYNNIVNGPVNRPPVFTNATFPITEGVWLQGYYGPCHHNEVTGNTFSGLAGVGVVLNSANPSQTTHHNLISGNRFVNCGNGNETGEPLYKNVGIWIADSANIYSNTITDNGVVSSAADCAYYRGVLMTVAELNAANDQGDVIFGNYLSTFPLDQNSLEGIIPAVNRELENHTSFGSWQAVGDGATTSFAVAPSARYIVDDGTWEVVVGGERTKDFTMDFDSGVVTFNTAPALSAPLTAKFNHAYWTEELVTQAVNTGINNLFPAFYVPKADTSISLVADTYEYSMPAETQFITAVETRAAATGAYTKMARSKYEWLSDGDHLNLRFFSAPTGFLRVRCINRPSPLVGLGDTLTGTSGLPERAKDPIISYACWYLLTQKIAPRVRSDIAVNTQGVGTLSPRQIADGTQAWMMRYQLQLAANKMPPWLSR